MAATKYEEAVINFEDYDEVEEGFPTVAPGRYLTKVTNPEIATAKNGSVYVKYTPVLLASEKGETPNVDRNGMEIEGWKLFPDRLFFVPNPLDKDGILKDEAMFEKGKAQLIGRFRTAMNGITGESFPLTNRTPRAMAEAVVDAIRGCTYVATVRVEKPSDNNQLNSNINSISKHEPESEWSRED